MKSVIHSMQELGIPQNIINVLLIIVMLFLFILGLGSAGIAAYGYIKTGTPSPFFSSVATTILTGVVGLAFSAHQTAAINGTATNAAVATARAITPAITQAAQANSAAASQITQDTIIAAIKQIMLEQSSQTQASILATEANTQAMQANTESNTQTQANTAATQANTAATEANTQVNREGK